jgi:aromatic ring-opening dioxygenase catalytic subunit (LigB family)
LHGFDLAKAEEVSPDHGVALPVLIAGGRDAIPVVPFYVNAAMDPVPAPGRCRALGGVLRRMVESERSPIERVVVMGTGGLSHWLCLPQMGQVNEEFDRWVLEHIVRGEGEQLGDLSAAEILDKAGNGGLELLNWIVAVGAAGQCRPEALYYEAVPEWLTGMGGVDMGVT